MKNYKGQPPQKNVRFETHKTRPENKDNLDSREGEEQRTKGNDITHNKKEVHNRPNRKKR